MEVVLESENNVGAAEVGEINAAVDRNTDEPGQEKLVTAKEKTLLHISSNSGSVKSNIERFSEQLSTNTKSGSVLPIQLLDSVTHTVKYEASKNASDSRTHEVKTHESYRREEAVPRYLDSSSPSFQESVHMSTLDIENKDNLPESCKNDIHVDSETKVKQHDRPEPTMQRECEGGSQGMAIDGSLRTDSEQNYESDRCFPDVDVFDLSLLFSGELEKRRMAELKKERRRVAALKTKESKFGSRKRKKEGQEENEDEGKKKSETSKSKKPVPNYFVAIQVPDEKISTGMKQVQDAVTAAKPILSSTMVSLSTIHLTIMVLSLSTEEDMIRSRAALDAAMCKLQSQYPNNLLKLDVEGLGHFRNQVVFACIPAADQMTKLQYIADVVKDSFSEQGIISPDKRGFNPHITLMKLSKGKGLHRKGVKKIDENLYKDFKEMTFGSQNVASLQLCSMGWRKQNSGYYTLEHEVFFPGARESVAQTMVKDNLLAMEDDDDKTFSGDSPVTENGKVSENKNSQEEGCYISSGTVSTEGMVTDDNESRDENKASSEMIIDANTSEDINSSY